MEKGGVFMSTTRDLMRKAGRRTGRMEAKPMEQPTGFMPLCPLPAATERPEREVSEKVENSPTCRVVVPQPIRENTVYRQLMRSHDRMGTRHV